MIIVQSNVLYIHVQYTSLEKGFYVSYLYIFFSMALAWLLYIEHYYIHFLVQMNKKFNKLTFGQVS